MNHFRVLLPVFLLSLLFHMLKGWAGCSGTHPLPQCLLVSISNRCCKLGLHLADWICLQDPFVRHALGFISDALSSPSQNSLCARRRSGRSGSGPGASSIMKRSWYLVGLLHAADHLPICCHICGVWLFYWPLWSSVLVKCIGSKFFLIS